MTKAKKSPLKVMVVFGTRPEAIKMAPVALALAAEPDLEAMICVTAQHRQMLDQVMRIFDLCADIDLDLMQPGQDLYDVTTRVLLGMRDVLKREQPDLVLVHGDTTTCFAAGLAAFYQGIPVGHVEAGLRTGDLRQPFPEELNRVLAGRIASMHFAATPAAAENLRSEGISKQVWVTGNTGIDAVLHVRDRLERGELTSSASQFERSGKRLILVTAHRRESFGDGFKQICQALSTIADREDVHVVYPVHPNPSVRASVNENLRSHPDITLTEPMDYVPFVDLMRRAYLILTDSGGIQEEAPSLGKPVLVLREKTERPEAVEAGTVKLVGTDANRIVQETMLLLDRPEEYQRMSRIHNPYGDGRACERIEAILRDN